MATDAASNADTIVLIHGLWLTPLCWEKWVDHYKSKGFNVLAPSWPGMEGEHFVQKVSLAVEVMHARSIGPYSQVTEGGVINFVEWYCHTIENELGGKPAAPPMLVAVAS